MPRARDAAILQLFFCLLILGTVLVAQYGFDLRPCPLCLYQRIPYAVAAVLALFQLAVRLSAGWRALLLGLGSVIFLVGGGLALFHVGVEQHWWAGPAACSGGVGGAKSVEDLISALSRPINIPSCDQVAWSLFGVSMAGYNVLASLVLAGFSGLAAWRSQEPKR